MKFRTAILLIIIAAAAGYFKGERDFKSKHSYDIRQAEHFRTNYLIKQGTHIGIGQYYIISLDGGRNWYEVQLLPKADGTIGLPDSGSVRLLGYVEPEKLKHIIGNEALDKYVREHGPLTFSGERAEKDWEMLDQAGLTIREK